MTTIHRWKTAVATLLATTSLVAHGRAQVLRFAYEGQPGYGAGHVTKLADLDGDGAADFAIGAPDEPNSDGYLGTVRAYSGRTGVMLWEVRGGQYAHAFGQALGDAGDVDGDGIGDIVIGDPEDDQYGVDGGKYLVYRGVDGTIYYGGAAFTGGRHGFAVTGFGDVDGDKKGDIAVSLMGAEAVLVRAGNVGNYYVWTGQPGGLFGHDVGAAGDVDADGVGDAIVGEPYFDGPGPKDVDVGRAVVYSGATGLVLWEFAGFLPNAHLGIAVDGIGDVDGDGNADLLVGADHDPSNGLDAGKATVYSGRTGNVLYAVTGDPGSLFGASVGAVGDMNGDGVGDFGVAAPEWGDVGRVTTYSGATGAKFHDYDHVCCFTDGEFWGFVTGADFDGDGDGDLAIGTPMFSDQVDQRGRVEIYGTSKAGWVLYGTGWPGTIAEPAIVAPIDPVIGGKVQVDVYASTKSTTLGLLFLGLADANVPTKKGGTLLVDPLLSVLIKIPSPYLALTDTLPDDPALADVELYLQAIEMDDGASNGLSFTKGLKLHLGYGY